MSQSFFLSLSQCPLFCCTL